jgi:NADPH2:quinone reductase
MKAMLMSRTGPADVLALCDIPEPVLTESTQIKVRLRAAGVNPIDTKIRRNGLLGPGPLPAILGCDGAGEVIEMGSEVDRFCIGDRVWFCHGGLGIEPGNDAEITVLDQCWAAPMPQSLDFVHAAAGPLVLITAWGMLYDRGRLQAGQTALIHAGAGGVGHVALQLAKLRGARVITTVGSAENAALAKDWGADEVINHREQDFVAEVNRLTDGQGADLVAEMVSVEVFTRSIGCTAHFGDLVTLLDPGNSPLAEARLRNLRIGFELMLTPQLRRLTAAREHQINILRQCSELIDRGQLSLHVSRTLPLEQAAEAHRQLEMGHTVGKCVLTMD